ncbi:MAG: hypothetical protein Q9207_003458 [Kuettlingeria erythrocarpa]
MKVTATLTILAAAFAAEVALAAPVVEHEAGVDVGMTAHGTAIRQCLPDGWCGASNAGIDSSCCSKHAVNDCCVAVKKRATPPLCVAGGNCSQGSPAGPKPDPKPDPEPSSSSDEAPSSTVSTDSAGVTLQPTNPPPLLSSSTPPPIGTTTPAPLLPPMEKRGDELFTHPPTPWFGLLPDATVVPIPGVGNPHFTVHIPIPVTNFHPAPEETSYVTPRIPIPSSLLHTVTDGQHHVGPGWSHTMAIHPFPTTLATVVDKRDA